VLTRRTELLVAALSACGVLLVIVLAGVAFRGPGTRPHAPATTIPANHAAPAARTRASDPAGRRPWHQDPLRAAASYVSARAGTVMAAVYDVKTGQTWRLGRGRPEDEASVVKLDVLEALLDQRGDSTSTGLSAADQSLAQQMIEDSSNDAATSLWDEVGGAGGIRSFNSAAGLTRTSPSPCVDCPGFPWPGWGLTTTTPTDQLALLRTLVEPTSLLTNEERSYALSLMEDVTPSQRWGVSWGVPAKATVALKNGWLPLNAAETDWQINSVGWVSGRGRNYLIAVLTNGNPAEQYGIDTIDGLAGIVWRAMR
jgi:Beta-lactamase enzyme family